jgi:beta-glucosidase
MIRSTLSRRQFLAGAALSAAVPKRLALPDRPAFPAGFLWGTSTSALQIEGALSEDGRGPSIWDRFAGRPGTIADHSTPEPACDHYRRWRQDIDLLAGLGSNAYRFSIAWPRVMPTGRGPVNGRGLDFYDRLVDGLLAAAVRPMPCLHHWDLPEALQERGGWLNRDIAGWLADYAAAVAARLGDRVKDWFLLNEPSVVAIFGHGTGEHAPGLTAGKDGVLAALHHQNLAQGAALRALSAVGSGFRLGTVLSLQPVHPAGPTPADAAAAQRWDALWNRVALDGLLRGRLPDVLAEELGHWVKSGDLEAIRFPVDRLGVNYYAPLNIQFQPGRLFDAGFGPAPAGPVTAMGWPVAPEGLRQILGELRSLYGNPRVLITENGAAYDDRPSADGRVADGQRVGYLRAHLGQVAQAIGEGCNVEGYLAWSLLDNWEWQFGYQRRFGLVYVDYPSQRRMPKDSFGWFGQVTRGGWL